jgi:sodium/hydrogen exchanger-like protein 6/7
MSRRTQLTTKYIFQVMAQLSENFIFIYLGLDLFTANDLMFMPLFIMIAVVGICVARYMSVFPLSKLINWFIRYRAKRQGREVADELPFAYQGMLFWAGLRGAVGVALAAGLEGKNARALRATVLVVVVLTVIIFGGTTARMLEILEIRTGVVEEIDSDDEFDIEVTNGGTFYKRSGTGIGHMPRRTDATIPLDPMDGPALQRTDSYSSGNNGHLNPRFPETGATIASRKNYSHRDRRARPREASVQTLLGSRDGSRKGSGSPGSVDEDRGRVHRSRGGPATLGPRNDADLDEFEFELDGLSDDDLPPAASSTLRRQQSRGTSQQRLSPSRVPPPAAATPPSGAESSTPLAGQSSGRPTLSGATNAFRGLIAAAREHDSSTWFRQLDEEYIKPTLLLDQGSGHHPKGPDNV